MWPPLGVANLLLAKEGLIDDSRTPVSSQADTLLATKNRFEREETKHFALLVQARLGQFPAV